jgi:hypothetical protein
MEAKLIQRRLELNTLLKTRSIGGDLMLANFKGDLRKEVGNLHEIIDAATKKLKQSSQLAAVYEIERGVRLVYAARREAQPIEGLKHPGSFTVGTKS